MVGRTVVRPYIRLFEPSNYGVVKGNWYEGFRPFADPDLSGLSNVEGLRETF